LSKILTKIYDTPKIKDNEFWNYFEKLGKYSHGNNKKTFPRKEGNVRIK
jgi:hypothetical protein